jgi:eukaryotic-like serine/threonine-protein kinase
MDAEARTRSDDKRPGDSAHRTLGRYRIVAELGRGSTSIVYLAAIDGPAGFNKLFALKQLRPALAEDPAFVAMFLTEARIGAQLSHPNVVSTFEIDDTEALPYIVMEYLDGQPLQRVVMSARLAFTPLPLHAHLASLSGALEGLGHAHQTCSVDGTPLKIVHRDVSPHNVFVTVSGATKLLDFGFAQTADSPNTMLSSAGRVAYMSPEQASRGAVDSRSDLFSVGVMMWEAVTRRRFWSEEASKAEIVRALASRELPPSRLTALASAPEALRSIVLKATAPDAADRYESAAAFQTDLQAALRQITPPAFDLRDIGKRIRTVFALDRARLQAAIDAQHEIVIEDDAFDRADTPHESVSPPGGPPMSVAPASIAPASGPPMSVPPASIPASGPPASVRPGSLPPASISVASPPPPRVSASPPPPRVSSVPAEDASAVQRRNSGPLPSFPIPATDTNRWRPGLPEGIIAAIALAALVGIGVSALHPRTDEAARAATKSAAGPAETSIGLPPGVTAQANTPAESMPPAPAPVAAEPAEPEPSGETAETAPARAGAPASPEGRPRSTEVPAIRPRAVVPFSHAPGVAPAPSSPPAASSAPADPSVRPSESHSPARAARPIDALNPYNP